MYSSLSSIFQLILTCHLNFYGITYLSLHFYYKYHYFLDVFKNHVVISTKILFIFVTHLSLVKHETYSKWPENCSCRFSFERAKANPTRKCKVSKNIFLKRVKEVILNSQNIL